MITSRHNSRVKRVRSLAGRKAREEAGLFFAEGVRLTIEACVARFPLELAVRAPDLLTDQTAGMIGTQLDSLDVPILDVSSDVFRSISTRDRPQGIGVVARRCLVDLDFAAPVPEWCRLALIRPQDPGNVGSILRTLDAVGASCLVLLGDAADPFDPRAVRGSMGSIFSIPIVRTSLNDLHDWSRRSGWPIIGITGDGHSLYSEFEFPHPSILLMGSEREGMATTERSMCRATVRLPMHGRADSLNLSVAAGVVLYEALRKRPHA